MLLSLSDGMAFCGVILILEGTVFTLIGQVCEKTESIVKRHLLLPGCNGDAIRSVIKQKRQTGFGLALILLGSVIQIISSMATMVINSSLVMPLLLVAIVFAAPLAWFLLGLNQIIKKQGEQAVNMALEKLRE